MCFVVSSLRFVYKVGVPFCVEVLILIGGFGGVVIPFMAKCFCGVLLI